MNNWKQISVGDFIDFNPSESISKGSIARKIGMDKLGTFQRKINGFEFLEYSAGPKFRNKDTLVAKITPCLENGKTAYVDVLEENEVAYGSSEFIVLRENEKSDSKFIYYLARSPWFRERAISCMEGTSGRKRVNEGALKRQEILVPASKFEQQKIAAVLSALDDKIELNNKINAELEAMAKNLYDYWFVQFDFPDEDGKPYKSSGGKMVYNESLKRKIPEGWEVKELDNLIDFTRGVSYTSKTMNDKEGIPMINLKSFNLNGTYRYDGIKYFTGKLNESRILDKGDLLIAITDVTREAEIIGRAIINPDFEKKSVCSCDVARVDIVGENLKKNYLRYLFNSNSYHDYIKHFASGTLVLHLDLQGVKWFTHAIPPFRIQNEFEKFINLIDGKIVLNQKQNQELAQLRDWLLPMLMNGQVKVE
ncbi:restriction endonuclease subunit S [Myroides odoratimimus]|uniref:restriction endonuclease subunit S n=1 Tax=Myroides odoratimimus TaxID=76832 RepID=UPI00046989B7|nr:restriction endonuclease subunit S [Myroides odoratimimus]